MTIKPGDMWYEYDRRPGHDRNVLCFCVAVYQRNWPSTVIISPECNTALVLVSDPARLVEVDKATLERDLDLNLARNKCQGTALTGPLIEPFGRWMSTRT